MMGGMMGGSLFGSSDPFSMMSTGGFSSTSSFGGGFGGGGFTSVSSSTSFVNGKQVQKTVRNENGVETVEIRENGVLTQKTVNGQQQAITENQNSSNSGVQAIRNSRSGGSSSRSSRGHRQVAVDPHQQINIRQRQHRSRPHTVHNIGLNDFAQSDDDFSRQMQQAMAESQRQASAAFFSNPFGSMFGQGGFPF